MEVLYKKCGHKKNIKLLEYFLSYQILENDFDSYKEMTTSLSILINPGRALSAAIWPSWL